MIRRGTIGYVDGAPFEPWLNVYDRRDPLAFGDHPAVARAASDEPPLVRRRFPIRLGRWARLLLWFFGVNEGNAHVDLGHELDASFGFFRLTTPVSNIARWRIEGPWLWVRAIGVRRSIRRGDLTFGGNHLGGVRLDFREPAGEGFLRTRTLYVTVADLEGLAGALAEMGVPGEGARRRRA